MQIGLYFFTFSARGQVENRRNQGNRFVYDRVRKDQPQLQYDAAQTNKKMPIVIDRSRDRYYYTPQRQNLDNEWQ